MKIRSFVSILILVSLLFGCTELMSQQKVAIPVDQLAFEQAFTEFQNNNQLTVLENYAELYPDSPWAGRARTVILYARELEQRKEQLKQQQQTLSEKEEILQQLSRENVKLNETLDQLKGSLIEMEQRPL